MYPDHPSPMLRLFDLGFADDIFVFAPYNTTEGLNSFGGGTRTWGHVVTRMGTDFFQRTRLNHHYVLSNRANKTHIKNGSSGHVVWGMMAGQSWMSNTIYLQIVSTVCFAYHQALCDCNLPFDFWMRVSPVLCHQYCFFGLGHRCVSQKTTLCT